jgi:hypothetical protein
MINALIFPGNPTILLLGKIGVRTIKDDNMWFSVMIDTCIFLKPLKCYRFTAYTFIYAKICLLK